MDRDTVHAWTLAGLCYEKGLEVNQSLFEAVKYYSRAADAGHERARRRVEYLLDYPRTDVPDAIEAYTFLAERGCLLAYRALGLIEFEGAPHPGCLRAALDCFYKCRPDTNDNIQDIISTTLEHPDLKCAKLILEAAVEHGDVDNCSYAARMWLSEGRFTEAVQLLLDVSRRTSPNAVASSFYRDTLCSEFWEALYHSHDGLAEQLCAELSALCSPDSAEFRGYILSKSYDQDFEVDESTVEGKVSSLVIQLDTQRFTEVLKYLM